MQRHVMQRRQRQLDELHDLCRSGRLARAIDLAFEHFAVFGREDEIVDLLSDAIARLDPAPSVRQRFAELTSA